jgi:hypothetical protein
VKIEGTLPSKTDIPSSVIDSIDESRRLAQLQETITNWLEHRGAKTTDVDEESDRQEVPPDAFSHQFVCSKELALSLTSELLGDYCTDEEDASNRYFLFS